MSGRLIGASLGPGDPGLITRAAWQALAAAPCWAFPQNSKGGSYALAIVEATELQPPAQMLPLHFPMTRDLELLSRSWLSAAQQVWEKLQSGVDVVFLVEGDASTYATFGHLVRTLKEIAPEAVIEIIPGVTSFNAAAARTQRALADGDETIGILSAPDALPRFASLLHQFDSFVLLKVRPVMRELIQTLKQHDLLDQAVFLERIGTADERVYEDLTRLDPDSVHYLSLVLLKNPARRA